MTAPTARTAARRERLRELLGLDFAGTGQGRLAQLPSDPGGGEPVEVQVVTPVGEEIPAFLLRPDPAHATGGGVVRVAGHGVGLGGLGATGSGGYVHAGHVPTTGR